MRAKWFFLSPSASSPMVPRAPAFQGVSLGLGRSGQPMTQPVPSGISKLPSGKTLAAGFASWAPTGETAAVTPRATTPKQTEASLDFRTNLLRLVIFYLLCFVDRAQSTLKRVVET